MESVKRFVAVILSVAIVMASLVTQSAGAADKKGLRTYYLTPDSHDGSEALTVRCRLPHGLALKNSRPVESPV